VTSSGFERLGDAIKDYRSEKRWTLTDLSQRLQDAGLPRGHSLAHLSEIERGKGTVSAELIEALDLVLEAHGRLIALLREAKVPTRQFGFSPTIEVDAHLFYPLNIVGEAPAEVGDEIVLPGYESGVVVHRADEVDGLKDLYLMPFGCAVAHEVHRLRCASLTEISVWRSEQIARAQSCTADHLARRTRWAGQPVDPDPYCLSYFDLIAGPWVSTQHLDNALKILANPSELQRRHVTSPDRALATEHALITGDGHDSELVGFSCSGSHNAWASWAAVASRNLDGDGAGIATRIATFEIQLQALWCYAYNVARSGETAGPEFGEKFLRKTLRRLTQPLPTEHVSDRLLREAITKTSRIEQTVNNAIDALREK
jgi:transcriptional regulator with XRE-family HTH domain